MSTDAAEDALVKTLRNLLANAKRRPGKREIIVATLQKCKTELAAARKNGLRYSEIAALLTAAEFPVGASLIAECCRQELGERRKKRRRPGISPGKKAPETKFVVPKLPSSGPEAPRPPEKPQTVTSRSLRQSSPAPGTPKANTDEGSVKATAAAAPPLASIGAAKINKFRKLP